ncbi:Odorant receptor 13a [Anthophora plagiata]
MEVSRVEKNYLDVNKTYGTVCGVWPYGGTWSKWIGRIIMLFITTSAMITQVAFVVRNLNTAAMIEQCPFFTMGLGLFLKELNYIIQEEKLKSLLESLFNDWLLKRPKIEMDIMDKYAKRGRFFNYIYVANGIFCYVLFTLVAIRPRLLDLISPKNESRRVGFIYPAYYGLDEQEHYYILMGHMLCVITVVFFVYISCDTIYMNVVQHACGLLGISGYRFKWAVQDIEANYVKKHNVMLDETYRKVCHSIRAHQHAINYIVQIESLHATYLFILIALIIISLSVTLVKTSMMEPCMDFYKYCCFLIVQLIHLFFLSIQGHFVIISHDKIYDDIYDSVWYNASPRTQALYMLALRKNLTPEFLTAGGLISLNLETFAEVAFVVRNLNTATVIEQCPFFTMGLGLFLKEMNYVIQEEKVNRQINFRRLVTPRCIVHTKLQLKSLLESLFNDWLLKRPKIEMDIMHKYAKRGRFFNYMYVANGIFCYVIFTMVAITPRVLDIVSPKNESRGVGFIYPAYYGLDEEEHYYILMGHMLCVITVVFFVYISCDTIYMNTVQHACGLLGISGHRFKWAIGETDENIGTHHAMTLAETYTRVRHSVKAHQHAVDYVMQIESLHATYLFIAVGMIILSFSVTLVKTSMMEPCVDFYKFCGFLVVQLIHLLFLCIQGHLIIIAHDGTYENIYEGVWYNTTPKTQAFYMLALRRNLTPPLLTAGGLISLDLDTFSEILKKSVSFFTVMKST